MRPVESWWNHVLVKKFPPLELSRDMSCFDLKQKDVNDRLVICFNALKLNYLRSYNMFIVCNVYRFVVHFLSLEYSNTYIPFTESMYYVTNFKKRFLNNLRCLYLGQNGVLVPGWLPAIAF